MKRRVLTLLLAGVLMICLVAPAAAQGREVLRDTAAVSDTGAIAAPRAEQTEWRYRTYNGKLQMRLWSITEGKWLTEWIDVNP